MIYHFLGKALMYQSPKIIFVCSLTNPKQLNGNEVVNKKGEPLVFKIKGSRKYNISARYWNATHTGTDYTGKEIENATGQQASAPVRRGSKQTTTPAP